MLNYYRKRKYKICEVLLITIKIFEKIGYWRPKQFDHNSCTISLYHTWTVIWWSWYLGSLMATQFIACFMYWPDINQVISAAALVFITNLIHTLKLINLILRRDLIKSHLNYFQTMNASENHNDPEIVEIIQRYEKNSFRDVSIYLFFSVCTCLGWAIIGNTTGDPWGFPLVAWYPFKTSYTPVFQVTYLHQVIAMWTCALLCVAIDTFSTNICVQVCCQFDLIRKHLRDVQIAKEFNIVNRLPDHVVYPKLSKIIARHSVLLRICAEVNLTIGWTVFAQFGVSSLIICITLYQFVAIPDQSKITLMAVFGYMISMTIQVFLYCYYGNQIIELSENIAVEATNSAWYLFSLKSKRALLILLQKSQQPVVIRAGGLVPLSIETFSSIMRASYSFFSVIQNFK